MKKNFESPLCTQAFDSVLRQRPLAEQLFNELLELGSVKIFAHICGWAPRRFQIASAMVSA